MPTALVTGPTVGLGLAFANALADRGHDLVLVSRDAAALERVADEIRGRTGVQVEVLPADLSSRESMRPVEERLADRTRPVDVLVNNAGFGLRTPFAEGSVDDEQQLLDVLVTAVLRLTHAAVGGMVERGRGIVINVSSIAGWMTSGTYSAAKAWVTVFSESLNTEVKAKGVRVTASCPGFMHTEFHQRASMSTGSIPDWMWIDVDAVVRDALRDAAVDRPISVTGLQYKAIGVLLRHAPRTLVHRMGVMRRRMDPRG